MRDLSELSLQTEELFVFIYLVVVLIIKVWLFYKGSLTLGLYFYFWKLLVFL